VFLFVAKTPVSKYDAYLLFLFFNFLPGGRRRPTFYAAATLPYCAIIIRVIDGQEIFLGCDLARVIVFVLF